MDMHHETLARRTRPDGLPVDYVSNSARTEPFDQSKNCMSQHYRAQAVGTAPEWWRKRSKPSLAVIKNGRRHLMTVQEFRGKDRKVSSDTAAEILAERQERKHRLLMMVGGYDQPSTR